MSDDRPLAEWIDRARAACNRVMRPQALIERRALHDRCLAMDVRALLATPLEEARYVALDTETTGFAAYAGDEIVQIALLEYRGLEPTGCSWCSYVRPSLPIPAAATAVHGITDEMVADAPAIGDIIDDVVEFMQDAVLVGHHIAFDLRFLNRVTQRELFLRLPHPTIDTMLLYLSHSGRLGHYELDEIGQACGVSLEGRHDAVGDARIAGAILSHLARSAAAAGYTVGGLIAATRATTRDELAGPPP
jgi:DNA polymerase-3 subunit epsilon